MRSPIRIRLEEDAVPLLRFLDEHQPGHEWEPDDLDQSTLKLRCERNGETVAYLWAQWVDRHSAEFHGCSKHHYWLTPEIMARIIQIAELFSIRRLACEPVGPTAARVTAMLLKRGFQQIDNQIVMELSPDGAEEEEAQDRRSRPAPAPGASATS